MEKIAQLGLSELNIDADTQTLYRDGIAGRKSALSRDFAEAMREDMMTAFWSAILKTGRCRWPWSAPLVS